MHALAAFPPGLRQVQAMFRPSPTSHARSCLPAASTSCCCGLSSCSCSACAPHTSSCISTPKPRAPSLRHARHGLHLQQLLPPCTAAADGGRRLPLGHGGGTGLVALRERNLGRGQSGDMGVDIHKRVLLPEFVKRDLLSCTAGRTDKPAPRHTCSLFLTTSSEWTVGQPPGAPRHFHALLATLHNTIAESTARHASRTCSLLLTTSSGLTGLLSTSSLTEMPSRYCFRMERRSAFSRSSRAFSLSMAVLSSRA